MKFGKSIEYHMINIFLEKSCAKCGRKAISRLFPFSKKSKFSISLDH